MSTKDFLNRNVSLPAGQIVQNEKFKFHVGKSVTNKRVEVQLSLRTPPPLPRRCWPLAFNSAPPNHSGSKSRKTSWPPECPQFYGTEAGCLSKVTTPNVSHRCLSSSPIIFIFSGIIDWSLRSPSRCWWPRFFSFASGNRGISRRMPHIPQRATPELAARRQQPTRQIRAAGRTKKIEIKERIAYLCFSTWGSRCEKPGSHLISAGWPFTLC